MKKLTGTFVALVAILLTAPAAQATTLWCVSFDNFCDGIEVLKRPDMLTGTWQNVDCAGTDATFDLVGILHPPAGRAICINDTCPFSPDIQWLFALDFVTNTFDLFAFDGLTVTPVQINQPYTKTDGTCTFAGDVKGGVPSTLR